MSATPRDVFPRCWPTEISAGPAKNGFSSEMQFYGLNAVPPGLFLGGFTAAER
jgi:hypothetical protein